MAFMRVWTVLLALLVAAAIGLAALVPRSANNDLLEERARRLEYARDSVHLLLKVNARTWMDTVRRMAQDGAIVDSLTEAGQVPLSSTGAGATVPPPLPQPMLEARAIVQPKLESFNHELKAELLWAIDAQGRVVAQVGMASMAGVAGIDLNDPTPAVAPVVSGIPVVEAALRGYDVADTWGSDGKLYRVAATPVFARDNDRYIGALLLADRVDDELARQLGRMLDIDVAFLVDGKVIAASLGASALPILAGYMDRYRKALQEAGRTRALSVDLDGGRQYQVAFARVSGEASERRATYAVLKETQSARGLIAFVQGGAGGALVRSGWVLALVIFLAVSLTAIGWGIIYVDGIRPLRGLIAELQAVERRELSRIREERFSLLWRVLAKSVQTLARRPPARAVSTVASRAANAVKQDRVDTPSVPNRAVARTHPGPPPSGGSPSGRMAVPNPPAVAPAPPPNPSKRHSGTNPTVEPPAASPRATDGPGRTSGAHDAEATKAAIPNSRASVSSIQSTANEPRGPLPEMPEEDRTPSTPPPMTVPPIPSVSPSARTTAPGPSFSPPGGVTPISITAAPRVTGPVAVPFHGQPGGDGGQPFSAPPPQAPALLDDAVYFRQVFEEFLIVRKRCGELVDSVSYERFIERLRENRDALMRQHQCRGVKFQVYVKDGKAALRATPVK